ncbi:MAG TPA: heparan-alpha-glucosaminide N-acetyltransferase domain-containing protein, partial [Polyangiales bacterium]|nr:heparan-alpha-glucosaminide N-acetyltransferase domain-containing protein [Polyangiales bacterium]
FGARGLTSVAFLFAAGFSFYLATAPGYVQRHRSPQQRASRVRRGLFLIVLGYALHFPILVWSDLDVATRDAAVRGFIAVDVLQCIGVSLLVLQAVTWLAPRASWLGAASALIALALFACTPLSAAIVPRGALSPLLSYLSSRAGSLFPLLPWAAHVFFGVACAAWVMQPGRLRREWRLLGLALALLASSAVLTSLGAQLLLTDQLMRLGRVLIVAACLSWISERMRALPGWMDVLSRETLALYVLHILFVYGTGVGLADQLGARLPPEAAVAWAALVVAASAGVVLGVRRWQGKRLAEAAVAG